MKRMIVLACVLVAVGGCATKRYGRMQPVAAYESANYTCKDIDLEMAKVDAFDAQVKQTAKFSPMSVASFMGDFGIGNVAERHAATKTSAERRTELTALHAQKHCGSVVAPTVANAETSDGDQHTDSGTAAFVKARSVATRLGCDGDIAEFDQPGRYVATCGSYRTLIECDGAACRPIRAMK